VYRIETCLAAMQATGNSVRAAHSTSGPLLLDLPEAVGNLIVLADGNRALRAALVAGWRAPRNPGGAA
jgi:putative DNA primase/helicase